MFNFDLTKISIHKLFFSVLTILSLIIPGFSYIFLQKYILYINLDISKILLLSIFFSLPVFFINITGEYFLLSKGVEKNIELATFSAMVSSLFSVYATIILYSLFRNFNFLIVLYSFNFIVTFFSTIYKYKTNNSS